MIHDRDGFIIATLRNESADALRQRGLPVPDWDPGEKVYRWPDDAAAAPAVRFLADAYDEPVSEEALARVDDLLPKDDAGRLRDLLGRLRPYQQRGAEFLADKRRAFLADGMGLGKSVQALAALEMLGAFPAIVVCPASVRLSWQAEILKWTPWRSVQVARSGRDRLGDVDLLILSPELLPRFAEEIFLAGPQAMVMDEAHYYKNPAAQRTQIVEALAEEIDIRFALSGTPIPNRRPDLIQQLRLLGQLEETLHIYRGLLPHWWTRQSGPLRHDHAMRVLEKLPRKELHQRLRAVCFLRRTKDQVSADLPAFHRTRRDLLLPSQNPYRQAEESFIDWVRRIRHEGAWENTHRTAGRARLSALRREAALAKIPAVVEWAEGLGFGGGGGRQGRDRVVYFTHHKQVARELAKALPGKHAVITGDVPPAARQDIIDHLDRWDGLVATMDSSGQGVDGMQMHARHVVFIELDWTPTKHEQCEGRLHRIGQKDRVEAWYFTAQDTIDAAMMRRLDSKWREVQGIVEGRDDETVDRFVMDVMGRAAKGVSGAALWTDLQR